MRDLSNVKAGFQKYDYKEQEMIMYCACGHTEPRKGGLNQCSNCGNSYYVQLNHNEYSKNIGAYFIDHLTVTSIAVTRVNFTATIQDNKFVSLRQGMEQTISFDYLNRDFKVIRNGEPTVWMKDGKFDSIDGHREYNLINNFKNVASFFSRNTYIQAGNIIMTAMRRASNINDYDYNTYELAHEFVRETGVIANGKIGYRDGEGDALFKTIRLFSTEESVKALSLYEKFIKANLNINPLVLMNFGVVANCDTTTVRLSYPDLGKLHKTIGLPKKVLGYLRSNNVQIQSSLMRFGQQVRNGEINADIILRIMTKAEEYNAVPDAIQIIDKLGEFIANYNVNTERLIEYLFEEIAMYQGITSAREGLTLLTDYISMSIELGFDYDKYPRSLKREHDVKMVNYNAHKKQIEQSKFAERVDDYRDLEYTDRQFSVVIPESSDDLVKEGSKLHHCIASYGKRVADGRSKIIFIRKTNEINKPFVSVEYNQDYELVQARGTYNEQPNEDVMIFLKTVVAKNIERLKEKRANEQAKRVHQMESF